MAPRDDQGPTWSRDGTRLAYWSQDAEAGRAELIVVAADGSDPTVVTTVEGDYELHPVDWSPDGTQLAFTTCPRTDEPSCELLVAAADGSGTDSLAEPSIATWTIRWSPDGSLVAFGGSRDDEQRSVRVISPEDGTERELGLLTNREDTAFSGLEWSPDGQEIVTQGGDEQPGIWVFPVEGSAGSTWRTMASSPSGRPMARRSPSWTAGARVHRPGRWWGGAPMGQSSDHQVAWSPDGAALAIPQGSGIAIVDAASGETLVQLPDAELGSWQRVAP